jgi:hypothetical protein
VEHSALERSFESEKNRKAFLYTTGVVGLFLIIAIFYTWPLLIPPVPQVQDLIDVNLGNEQEGMGTVQPMVRGERAPDNQSVPSQVRTAKVEDEPSQSIQADDNNDKEAAPVVKVDKPRKDVKEINKPTKTKETKKINPSPVINPNPAPPKPKIPLYKGGNGKGGNGAAEDNGFRNQGYKPGSGDAGSPGGNPDSYGDSPGGRIGGNGPRVTNGDRRIIRYYSFTDDLGKAKIFAIIKVSPGGRGTFAGFGRNSSTTDPKYAQSISRHLADIQFDKSDHESTVTVEFNFDVR